MIFATVSYRGKEELSCLDKVGSRAFLLQDYFIEELKLKEPITSMVQFIEAYEPIWTDRIAFFFGSKPEYAVPLDEMKLLAPIVKPARNLLCLGKNYQAHAQELKGQIFSDRPITHPIYFTKPDHTVIGTGETIKLHSKITSKLDYEVELAVIIGKKGINIPKEKAEEHIFGYTIANDVSARDLQHDHSQWYKGKSLESHCPMGPWIVHKNALPYPPNLKLKCWVNDDLRQDGNTKDLIFDIANIISDLSRAHQLRPGDIILTGTPAGVGMGFNPPKYLKAGDLVTCEIEGIGSLINPVGD